jgi:hypothetical protein
MVDCSICPHCAKRAMVQKQYSTSERGRQARRKASKTYDKSHPENAKKRRDRFYAKNKDTPEFKLKTKLKYKRQRAKKLLKKVLEELLMTTIRA